MKEADFQNLLQGIREAGAHLREKNHPVARIDRIDRDDRQVAQILAVVAQRLARNAFGFVQRLGLEAVGNLELVDRDQREAARCERIAQALDDADGDARRSPAHFRHDEVAGRRAAGWSKVSVSSDIDSMDPY